MADDYIFSGYKLEYTADDYFFPGYKLKIMGYKLFFPAISKLSSILS
jgi:hypothetical protein